MLLKEVSYPIADHGLDKPVLAPKMIVEGGLLDVDELTAVIAFTPWRSSSWFAAARICRSVSDRTRFLTSPPGFFWR